MPEQKHHKYCPLRKGLEILGGKWPLLILLELKNDPKRFSELKRGIIGISEKMLIQNLKMLEAHELISRHDFKTIPLRVEYKILPKGIPALEVISILVTVANSTQDDK